MTVGSGTPPLDSLPDEIPAATLVVFRQPAQSGGPPEILMTVRSSQLAFAGGAAVFPGGRVDPGDRDLARALVAQDASLRGDPDELAHRIAAIRETLEETGLAVGFDGDVDAAGAARARALLRNGGTLHAVLETTGWRLAPGQLVPFARWCPRGVSHHRIFDTRFYLGDLGTGRVEVAADASETTALFWITAAEALDRAQTGELRHKGPGEVAVARIDPAARENRRSAREGELGRAHGHQDFRRPA